MDVGVPLPVRPLRLFGRCLLRVRPLVGHPLAKRSGVCVCGREREKEIGGGKKTKMRLHNNSSRCVCVREREREI